MVNPPKEGVNSPEVVEKYKKEVEMIFSGLQKRSKILEEKLNLIPGLKTNLIEGAMYAYARIFLTDSAIKAAKEKGVEPDAMYCEQVLRETGLVTVPGSGFKQKEGTYHFRLTNLIYNTDEFDKALDSLKTFNENFFKKYP